MAELLRITTIRTPAPVKSEAYPIIAIDSHPPNYQSTRFKNWVGFCESKDYETLTVQLINFLKSDHSITSLKDYPTEIKSLLEFAISKGKTITEDDIIGELTRKAIHSETLLKLLSDPIRNTSDTFLALVLLKNTSSINDISYQDILKLLFYVDHVARRQKNTRLMNLKDYLGKQVMLPACFVHINPCSKKIERKADYLVLDDKALPCSDLARYFRDEKSSGCVEEFDKETGRSKCECEPDENCVEQNPCCAMIKPYITDLMVVREEVRCYLPGELSYIENILMGEDRTREHRRLERIEEYEEQEKEISRYIEKDHQETERFSLQKETDTTIKQDLSLDAGVTYTAKYGTAAAGTSLSTSLNASYDSSKSTAQKIAQDYSKDVINRALTKVEEKIRDLVTRKRIVETEEKNTHIFKNSTPGEDNISGQYFYVNKISRAQVFNYGKRLLCDFLVPEPAELYKRLLSKQFKFDLEEPQKPAETPTTITATNYLSLIQKYGLKDCEAPPEMTKNSSMHIEGDNGKKNRTGCKLRTDLSITVPINFVTESMSCQEVYITWNNDGGVSLTVTLGGESLGYNHQDGTSKTFTHLPSLEGTQPLGFQTWDVTKYDIILTVNFKLKGDLLLQWQISIYNKIMEIYEKQKKDYDDAYNKALEDFEKNKATKYNRNPFLNRETERIALKQMAISYISCKFFDEMDSMKNKVRPCGFPQMDLEEAEREGRWVQFFEQAFEWPLMTYLFYPYFWGRKCTWVDKMKIEADDSIFEKFLQAGFARLQITVRPGFEELVMHFLAFGDIWSANDYPPLPGTPYYVSMAQEIREQKGNYYADREGTLQFIKEPDPAPNDKMTLTDDTKYYWDDLTNGINQLNINTDIDREIIIDCKVYRIISIIETVPADPDHKTWTITIDRKYDGGSFSNMKWSTGAVYIGAPWEFITPTELVWLKGKAKCLPTYPIDCI